MSYNRGFFMLMKANSRQPLFFVSQAGNSYTPVFTSREEARKFMKESDYEDEWAITEVAIGKA